LWQKRHFVTTVFWFGIHFYFKGEKQFLKGSTVKVHSQSTGKLPDK